MQLNKKTMIKLSFLIAGALLFAWLLNNFPVVGTIFSTLWGIIFPFILGFIIAFLLNIPMRWIERVIFRSKGGRLKRPLSFILTIVLLLGVLAFVVFLVGPQLVSTIATLISSMPEYIDRMQEALQPYEQYIPQIKDFLQGLELDWSSIAQTVGNAIYSGATSILSSAWGIATSIVGGLVSFFIGVVFAAYLLLDKEHLTAQLNGLLQAYVPEKKYNKFIEISQLVNRTYSKFISGQCLEAVAIGTAYFIILSIGQFQYALLISVLIGVTSLIPIIGAFIGCIVGALLILVAQGFWRALIFVILFLVVQQLDGNFMYPHIVGNSVGLPAVWILVAVTVGGGLMGIPGMLFFIPLFSVLFTLLRKDATARLEEKGIVSPVKAMLLSNPSKTRRNKQARPPKPPRTPKEK